MRKIIREVDQYVREEDLRFAASYFSRYDRIYGSREGRKINIPSFFLGGNGMLQEDFLHGRQGMCSELAYLLETKFGGVAVASICAPWTVHIYNAWPVGRGEKSFGESPEDWVFYDAAYRKTGSLAERANLGLRQVNDSGNISLGLEKGASVPILEEAGTIYDLVAMASEEGLVLEVKYPCLKVPETLPASVERIKRIVAEFNREISSQSSKT
ncbi:MAG: hypothetical protein V1820_05670 [archaeon]